MTPGNYLSNTGLIALLVLCLVALALMGLMLYQSYGKAKAERARLDEAEQRQHAAMDQGRQVGQIPLVAIGPEGIQSSPLQLDPETARKIHDLAKRTMLAQAIDGWIRTTVCMTTDIVCHFHGDDESSRQARHDRCPHVHEEIYNRVRGNRPEASFPADGADVRALAEATIARCHQTLVDAGVISHTHTDVIA